MSVASWNLVEADATERLWFADLATTLAHASEPAAPRNRWREVRRLALDGRTYYLKVFWRTQRKNAWRLRTSRPPARTEAEREAGLARALAEAGFAAPRVVAVGRDGESSYFLSAALEGTALRACLATPGADTDASALLRAAALAAGSAARTVSLPDTSADHVFVSAGADGTDRFAFLDLHNGTLGRASGQTLRRALRHSATSLHDLPLSATAALRAAVAFLRAADVAPARRRRLLRRLPPWRTHSRYDAPGKSEAYAERDPRRTQRELALLAAVWPGQPGERVLDAPCGTGRLFAFLHDRGHRVVGADRARNMLRAAAAAGPATLLCADAAQLPLRPGAVHGVVTFRFLHHLEPASARRVVEAAARAADRWLVLSVFHPWSAHALWRTLRTALGGGRTRFALAPRRITAWLGELGFVPERRVRQGWARELCVLSFRRRDSSR